MSVDPGAGAGGGAATGSRPGGAVGAGGTPQRVNYLVPDVPRWPVDPAKPVIALEGVHKRFGDLVVLGGLDLEIATGQTTVICGQSGSGKSVLLRLMNGLMLPDEGTVRLFGEDTRTVSPERLIELRKRVTMLFQSYALMDSFSVVENIGFPLIENTRMKWPRIRELAMELLELLDLADAADKMPSELSGGMKKRVSLARAVVSNPEVVLFDEPTTGLDPIMIEFVDEMIQRTQERYEITSVVISHDMTSTLHLADRVAMLDGGRIVAFGELDDVLASRHPLVDVFFEGAGQRLVKGAAPAGPDASPATEPVPELTRRSTEPYVPAVTGGAPATEASSAVTQASAAVTPIASPSLGTEAVAEVIDIHKSFGRHKVLRGVSLRVPRNRITVLIGGSGSGKSVTMKHIIGIFKPDSGVVRVFGQDITRLGDVELLPVRARFGMLFQGAALLDSMSVRDNVRFPLIERGLDTATVDERADEVLEQLRIAEIGARFPDRISNGQRKRVGLARAIVTKPEIMIYDEPTTGQDPVMARYVDDMIVEAQELFDITSLVVSHDMPSTFRVGHQVAMLHLGRIRAAGPPAEVLASPDPYVRRFIYAGSDAGEQAAREIAELELRGDEA